MRVIVAALALPAAALAASGCRSGASCPAGSGVPVSWVDPGALCDGVTPTPGMPPLRLETVATGLDRPVWIGAPAGDVDRLFIVEQSGTVRIVRDGALLPDPFLDLSGRVSCCDERGLLSVAFHPDYRDNGRLFVDYTNNSGNTVVSELAVCGDPDHADASSERVLLRVGQPFANHNGGQLQFGPDGDLYVGLGDGGSAGDPGERAQDLGELLGKILRIDVSSAGGAPYAIPPDNPFAGVSGAEPEIYLYGLRNPWRFSFDRATGDLYIGDVGQDSWEEIDFLASVAGGAPAGGANLGWDDCEGLTPFEGTCDGSLPPVLVYDHGEGCSVTGGFVYRGCALPGWAGAYFYSDYCYGFVRAFTIAGGAVTAETDLTADLAPDGSVGNVSAFGEDARGELYMAEYSSGTIYRIVAE